MVSYIMICQPIDGLTDEQICKERRRATNIVKNLGYVVVNSYFNDYIHSEEALKAQGVKHIPLSLLSDSIRIMSKVDAVFFTKGWHKAMNGIEDAIANTYNIPCIFEGDDGSIEKIENRHYYTRVNDAWILTTDKNEQLFKHLS